MNQNGAAYPEGYVTLDDTWVNQATQHHNQSFGWRGSVEGRGIREFGQMLSNAESFKTCMVQRVFKEVCKREPQSGESEAVAKLAQGFESEGFKLRKLFENVALTPACLGI